LVAIETVRRYGKENVTLLNHDISSKVEHEDIKRFKNEVADYLGLPITYANSEQFTAPLDVVLARNSFQFSPGRAICTYELKTKPFYNYLESNCQDKENYTIMYGFDESEEHRISRRTDIMRASGYKTDYPLTWQDRTIKAIEEIGIQRPITYKVFKHANCIGCLKAGRQHWYAVYCMRRDIFDEAKGIEKQIGYTIIKGASLSELEEVYEDMFYNKHICCTEHTASQRFWADVENTLPEQESMFPCDCSF